MKPILLVYERMVFQAEGWGIVIAGPKKDYLPYASHNGCSGRTWGYRCWDTDYDTQTCGGCGDAVPECIVTLIMLEGWKR